MNFRRVVFVNRRNHNKYPNNENGAAGSKQAESGSKREAKREKRLTSISTSITDF